MDNKTFREIEMNKRRGYEMRRRIYDMEKLARKALDFGELKKYDFYMAEVKRLRSKANATKIN